MPPPKKPIKKLKEGPECFGFQGSSLERRLKDWGNQFEIKDTVCGWSDLLGFGGPLIKANWNLGPAAWKSIADRLQRAYSIHLTYPAIPDNHMLLLNDGVVRTLIDLGDAKFCWHIGMWIRDLIWAHIDVTAAERAAGLPGTRTIITGGQRANYSLQAAVLEDFVIPGTKVRDGLSIAAAALGNPTIASNPSTLQMNTAFSKAYILDDYGSDAGIEGSSLFVEQSFFDLIITHADRAPKEFALQTSAEADGTLWALKFLPAGNPEYPWTMGFILDANPIVVDKPEIQTTVHRVVRFFPYDEKPGSFSVPIPWYRPPPK